MEGPFPREGRHRQTYLQKLRMASRDAIITCKCTGARTHTHQQMHRCTHTHTPANAPVHAHTHTPANAPVHAHTHTPANAPVHARTRTHTSYAVRLLMHVHVWKTWAAIRRMHRVVSFWATAYLHARLGDEAILVSLLYHVAVRGDILLTEIQQRLRVHAISACTTRFLIVGFQRSAV
jgi:hypothetical protein